MRLAHIFDRYHSLGSRQRGSVYPRTPVAKHFPRSQKHTPMHSPFTHRGTLGSFPCFASRPRGRFHLSGSSRRSQRFFFTHAGSSVSVISPLSTQTFKNPLASWLGTGGQQMVEETYRGLTMEEVEPRGPPEWLISHWRTQMQNPQDKTRGGPNHILTLHPTEAARRQALEHLAAGGHHSPTDRENHHTLDSLVSSLQAELRLPRNLHSTGPFSVVMHHQCAEAAKRLEFPLMHGLPDHEWGKGKTREIANLSHSLREEEVDPEITPDLTSFRRLSRAIAEKLGHTHPDDLLATLTKQLEQLDPEEPPFGLARIDGIVILDHPPVISGMRSRLLTALNRFRPIHVLANHGSYRLGIHGLVPNDISPTRTPDDLPDWLPAHDLWSADSSVADEGVGDESDTGDSVGENSTSLPVRMLVTKKERMVEATHALVDAAINSESPPSSILIVDPALDANHERWSSALDALGIRLSSPPTPLITSPGVHWLTALTSLPHDEDAWSLSQLRAIATQKTLRFSAKWLSEEQHPSQPEVKPRPRIDILEGLGRGFHLMAGEGALHRWLWAASREPIAGAYQDEDAHAKRCEENQWWLLALANRLKPLLSPRDAAALADPTLRIGCMSKVALPLPEPDLTADAWLATLAAELRWFAALRSLDGGVNSTIAGLQNLFAGHCEMRNMQRVLNIPHPSGGREWVSELSDMIRGMTLAGTGISESGLRLLSPADALGCTADLVILTHLDSESWSTSPPTIPGLSENIRTEMGVLPPDSRLRIARHVWNHLLNAGREVIVMDTAKDEDAQPSAPLSEWLATMHWNPVAPPKLPSFISPDEVKGLYGDVRSRWGIAHLENEGPFPVARPSEIVDEGDGEFELVVTGSHPRDLRQRCGIAIHRAKNPSTSPLNPSSITIPMDVTLVEDRLDRAPHQGSHEQPYLDPKRIGELLSVEGYKMQPPKHPLKVTAPRFHPNWPTIGLKSPTSSALTVDPRPLSPDKMGLTDHDLRHGYVSGPKASVKVWSPSRLAMWLVCPRKGWLTTRLRADMEDAEDDDVDARTRGQAIHEVWADFICSQLGCEVGEERENLTPANLFATGKGQSELKKALLTVIDEKVPWLGRADAVASTRRLDLVGLSLREYESALESGDASKMEGRFNRLLQYELQMQKTAIAAIEWPLVADGDGKGVLLTLPEREGDDSDPEVGDSDLEPSDSDLEPGDSETEIDGSKSEVGDSGLEPGDSERVQAPAESVQTTAETVQAAAEITITEQESTTRLGDSSMEKPPASSQSKSESTTEHDAPESDATGEKSDPLPEFRVRGTIDRVEVIPHPERTDEYIREDGEKSVCPLDIDSGEEWKAKRLILIRDLKSVEGPKPRFSGKRHQREVLEGVQLALYARAWELTHPGDRVIGVGISEIGEEPGYYIEADPDFIGYLRELSIGDVGSTTDTLFRRPGEGHSKPTSNSFRAWMRHRLSAANRIHEMSASGKVVATPSKFACGYCQVKDVCGLASVVGGDKKWN